MLWLFAENVVGFKCTRYSGCGGKMFTTTSRGASDFLSEPRERGKVCDDTLRKFQGSMEIFQIPNRNEAQHSWNQNNLAAASLLMAILQVGCA